MSQCNDFPIEIYQGKIFNLPIAYVDSSRAIIPLNGYVAAMEIRTTPESTDPPLVTLNTTNGGIVIENSLGTINVWIEPSETLNFPAGEYVYDLFIGTNTDYMYKLIGGVATVRVPVTK